MSGKYPKLFQTRFGEQKNQPKQKKGFPPRKPILETMLKPSFGKQPLPKG